MRKTRVVPRAPRPTGRPSIRRDENYNDYMSGPIRAVLCDLDDTLFDHRHATRAALAELRSEEPAFERWPAAELEHRHAGILEELHVDVLAGRRTIDEARRERFGRLLEAAGADRIGDRAEAAATFYRTAYERAWQAVPGAIALVTTLGHRGVPVVIVTNNGVAEQRRKLERVGLARHASALVTSEEVGVSKPARRIFEVALEAGGAGSGEAVMLGDAWHTDITGARDVGIRAVWFNRLGLASPDASVPELENLEPTDRVLATLFGEP